MKSREEEEEVVNVVVVVVGGGGGGGGGGGECGNIRNSGLLAPECGPRKEGTRCQGNNLLLGLLSF